MLMVIVLIASTTRSVGGSIGFCGPIGPARPQFVERISVLIRIAPNQARRSVIALT
jgi:hypothetical protein